MHACITPSLGARTTVRSLTNNRKPPIRHGAAYQHQVCPNRRVSSPKSLPCNSSRPKSDCIRHVRHGTACILHAPARPSASFGQSTPNAYLRCSQTYETPASRLTASCQPPTPHMYSRMQLAQQCSYICAEQPRKEHLDGRSSAATYFTQRRQGHAPPPPPFPCSKWPPTVLARPPT